MHFKSLIIILLFSLCYISCNKNPNVIENYPKNFTTPQGMVWVPGAVFTQGARANDSKALPHENPAHSVAVDGFFMDATEVTNAQFQKFVKETGYLTVAERPVVWEEMKKLLPKGTPKPADSLLIPGSLVFNKDLKVINGLNDYQQWWQWMPGANWQHPYGPDSNLIGKENYPVVHVTIEDALAYCKWANRTIPTEAQWELAATGNLKNTIYTWGNDDSKLDFNANTWNGNFPLDNTNKDGYTLLSPVKSYAPNTLGIYEIAGNVWEYTLDWYNVDYYQELLESGKVTKNPKGALTANNPNNPYQKERIIKGGSFLCNDNYCSSFRISARMGMTEDSSSDHVGFRTIATIEMLEKN